MSELRRFESSQRAHDRESDDDSQMLILGANGKTAEECYIAAIEQTVAEANPEYPASDPVADVAFVKDTEDSMGIGFGTDDVLELYADGNLKRARIMSYAYPESRLVPVEGESDAKNTDTADDWRFRTRGKEKPRQSPRKIHHRNDDSEKREQ
ncbi:MAG TPA: hypothetical protein VFJ06_14060 [Halococcus sp.]|nr:hypothetical protein [Halococcus sp.]